MNFWKWLFRGDVSERSPIERVDHPFGVKEPGYYIFLDKWLFLHCGLGVLLAHGVHLELSVAANTVLVPLSGIFIGLSFTWGGNALSLMQTDEIERLADNRIGGLRQYVYKFQSAIMVILGTMIFWGLAGLKLFDFNNSCTFSRYTHFILAAALYALTSCAMRECWHVVLGAQNMLLLRRAIRKLNKE
jgi:hypothetical protein